MTYQRSELPLCVTACLSIRLPLTLSTYLTSPSLPYWNSRLNTWNKRTRMEMRRSSVSFSTACAYYCNTLEPHCLHATSLKQHATVIITIYVSIYLWSLFLSLPFFRERGVMESAIQTMVKVFLKSSKGRESLGKKEFQNLVSSQLGNILTVRKSLLKSQNCCLYLDYVIIFHKSRQWCCVSPGQP